MRQRRTSAKLGIVVIVAVGLADFDTARAANDDGAAASDAKEFIRQYDDYDQKLRRLETYEKLYSREIFEFCINLHGLVSDKLRSCMRTQGNLKTEMLAMAQRQLGERRLAESVYDNCLAYYPGTGVVKAVVCVETRLMLNAKIGDAPVEKAIYQKCDSKWRRHGSRAVNNCCLHEGNYYLRYGELRDR